ncbi:MAG: type II toxin-antitoxin system VapC family toxin [Chlorogloeopsis fritschii C42_A2020_084]|jgi:PIN domain nuclease of toxin-antitoxin system|uniref:type II toxin-antitoxin system VapC family toxin n=1 Tax=Chlorogloeopsis fritschii TaxID=1124 RepID=UPI0019EAFD71|nr:type II toxin-antitoxin system VapC family toxin [Chlorogloeopsis fritschii]MBF2007000.1 type II toxin-antitoxin system VapC family toxin [Chlorogloeopsis fritschii C42_A2020_084]
MKLLLDTHVLIWCTGNPEKLSEKVTNLLTDTNNYWLVSIASIWEMQIKLQIKKLNLALPLSELIESLRQTNDLQILPIKLNHIYTLQDLPNHHRDPFDRILVAQAIVENIPLVSKDEIFDAYPIKKFW